MYGLLYVHMEVIQVFIRLEDTYIFGGDKTVLCVCVFWGRGISSETQTF